MRRSLQSAWEAQYLRLSELLPRLVVAGRSLHFGNEPGLHLGQTPVWCAFVLHLIPVATHVWHESPEERPPPQTKSVRRVLRSSLRCEGARRTSRKGGYA